jgi:hypothetical protein
MNIARLQKRDPEKEHGPVLPDLGDPHPLRLLRRGAGMGPDRLARHRSGGMVRERRGGHPRQIAPLPPEGAARV